MRKESTNYTLPEWTFLNGDSHEGVFFEGRSVILHFPSFTILEVISVSKIRETPAFQFQITDDFGEKETLQFYTHCTLSDDLEKIFKDSAIWYFDNLRWEENNIVAKEKSKQN